MDSRAAEIEVRRRWAAIPSPPAAGSYQPASPEELLALEVFLGRRLPNELREWLAIASDKFELGSINTFLCVSRTRNAPTIVGKLRFHPTWAERGLIPIADDGCGNEYVLDAGSSPRAVYFWDHEVCEPESFAYAVASSLWHFVLGVLMEEDAQDEDPESWYFDRESATAFDPDLTKVQRVPMPWEADR